jgi:RNA-directed DNA polymerase
VDRQGIHISPQSDRGAIAYPENTNYTGLADVAMNLAAKFGELASDEKGKKVVRQVTDKKRYARALAAVTDWCRTNRHRSMRDQHDHLTKTMRGHYAYYGITGNIRRLCWYSHQVVRIWRKWLSRRDRRGRFLWSRLEAILKRHPLPSPRIVHRYTAASETLP